MYSVLHFCEVRVPATLKWRGSNRFSWGRWASAEGAGQTKEPPLAGSKYVFVKTRLWITEGHCDKRNSSRWQSERKKRKRLNQGESQRPLHNPWSSISILHTDSGCKGTQTAHRIQAHTLRPHRCSSASEKRKSGSPPFHQVRGQKNPSMNQQSAHLWP